MSGLKLDHSSNFQLLTPSMLKQLKPGDCFYWCSPLTGWTRCWIRRVVSVGWFGQVDFWLEEDAVSKREDDVCSLPFKEMLKCGVLK